MTHTKGPWVWGYYGPDDEWVRTADGEPVVHIGYNQPEREANGRATAALPALIDSLRETLRALEAHLDDDTLHEKLSHRDHLCPCNQNEVARAKALLKRIDKGDA